MRRSGSITTFLGAVLLIATSMLRGSGIKPVAAATVVPLADTTLTPRFHDGRPILPVKSLRMRVTAYSPDYRSCGDQADGITASGYSVHTNGGRLVAADRRLFKFGELVSIPGYAAEHVVPVLDRGGAIKGDRIDVLYPTHERAMQWGVKYLVVTV